MEAGINVQLNQKVSELVSRHIVVVTAVVTGSGIDIWARVTQPHPRLGILPNESFGLDSDIMDLLHDKVVKAHKKIDLPGAKPVGSKKVKWVENLDRAELADIYTKRNLGTVVHDNGVKNLVTSRSLTEQDSSLSDDDFALRCMYIADQVGNQTMKARISPSPSLRIRGVSTLAEWWARADGEQRFTILTSSKKFGNIHSGAAQKVKDLLIRTPCPFRNSEGNLGEEETPTSSQEEGWSF